MSVKAKAFLKRMKKRLLIIYMTAVVIFVILCIRVVYLGVARGDEYQEEVLSQQNYDSIDLPYERGEIIDRNGNVLATSRKEYNLVIEPKNILDTEKKTEATKKALNQFFGVTEEEFNEYMKNENSLYNVIQKGVTYSQVKEFQEYCESGEGTYVTGVWFETAYNRSYPNGTLACHVLGYTVGGNIGQGGIEGYYNSYLNGVNGKRYGYLTTDNTVESVTVPASNGYTIVSTLDLNVQKIIEEGIQEYMNTTGAEKIGVLAMDPNTGEILGMSCSYSYDPNDPMNTSVLRNCKVTVTEDLEEEDSEESSEEVSSENSDEGEEGESSEEASSEETEENTEEIDTEEEEKTPEKIEYDFSEMSDEEFKSTIKGLSNNQTYEALNHVWRNFCISDNYEPGSTFKTFTIAGALEDGVVHDGDTYYCDGNEVVVEGQPPIYCHNRNGDGTLTLKGALEHSCNDALMQIAKSEGREIFAKYQDIFNFGTYTGVDLLGEEAGLTYSVETLNPAELATSSFGQGVNTTMIQMGAAFCSVINGGNYYMPHVVKQILDENNSIIEDKQPELVRKTISKATSDLMKDYLYGVVTEGTGTRAAVEGYTIGGKTGTAEKLPRGTGQYILSFIGFSPVENPQIMLYVVVDCPNTEDQSSSGAGALLFHDIMEELLPYMNIYQSSDKDVLYNGKDENVVSPFDDETATEASTDEEGNPVEGDTTEAVTEGEEDTGSETDTEDTAEQPSEDERILDE